jgi:hypothetical protein
MNFTDGPLRSQLDSDKLDYDINLAAENENGSIYEQLPLTKVKESRVRMCAAYGF